MERYKIVKVVGDGSFGRVYRAVNTATGEVCAIKKMKKKFCSWEECLELREVKSLRKFNSPFIVKLKEVFRVNDELHLVFEYMEENVYEVIKDRSTPLPEAKIKNIIGQVLQGLSYMNKHGYFHRDLKPENLMTSGTVCKITDFGLAREIRSRPPFTEYVSTRWYRAPEILLRSTSYNSPVDLFAVGCIMAELYMNQPLAAGTTEGDQLFKLCSVLGTPNIKSWPEGLKLATEMNYRFPSCQSISLASLMPTASYEALELMNALLQWDPQKRPTALESLKFSYFDQSPEEPPKHFFDISDRRNSSKWSNGTSRITGNSSKGKWSFRASNKESADPLPSLKDSTGFRQSRSKFDKFSPKREFFLPPVMNKQNSSRKASRDRAEARLLKESPRLFPPKNFTNPMASPRLPPISSMHSVGNMILGKGTKGYAYGK